MFISQRTNQGTHFEKYKNSSLNDSSVKVCSALLGHLMVEISCFVLENMVAPKTGE